MGELRDHLERKTEEYVAQGMNLLLTMPGPSRQKIDSMQKKYRLLAGLHLKREQDRVLLMNHACHLRQNGTGCCCLCCAMVSSGAGRLAV